MIKTIIIDDEPLARMVVKEYLGSYENISIVQECNDGFEGVKAITQYKPQLIFLDVQMPKITGFEMLELLDPLPSVIFTTAFDEYAIKAFEAQAIDYLLKPFTKERFDKAIQKWFVHYNVQGAQSNLASPPETISTPANNRIVIKSGSNIKIIPVKEILYIEAYDDYVKIHTSEGMFLKKKTMNHYEQMLDSRQFVRLHRSYLVQVSSISKIEPMEKESHVVLLKNGSRIPASRTGYKKLKELLAV